MITFKNINWPEKLTLIVAWLVGLLLFILPVVGYSLNYFPGDLGDGRLNMYFLEHCYQYFTGHVDSFWDAPFIHPYANVIALSDNLLGTAPIYALFRGIGMGNFAAYQWWYVVVTSLNFFTAYILLKHVFNNNAAILGAFVFAFSIGLQSQIAHAQTFPRFAIPLMFFWAVKFTETWNARYFFLSILALVYQIYCGIYLGLLSFIPLFLFYLVTLVSNIKIIVAKIRNWRWDLQILASIAINIIILIPLIRPYLNNSIKSSKDHYDSIFSTIPSVKSYLFSSNGSFLWDFLENTASEYPAYWDHYLFPGGIGTVCVLISVFFLFRKFYSHGSLKDFMRSPSISLAISGLITFVLFLRIMDFSAYKLIYFLPGYSAMRSITRIINIELLFIALATAYCFVKLLKSKNSLVVFYLTLSALVLDNYIPQQNMYITKVSDSLSRTKKFNPVLKQLETNEVISYEPSSIMDNPIYYQIDAMLMSQEHNLKCINGYTATSPIEFSYFWGEPNEKNRNIWLKSVKDFGFDELVVINDSVSYNTVSRAEIKSDISNDSNSTVDDIIELIKTNDEWMKQIESKAQDRGISIDSMIVIDAIWVLENDK